jgi:ribosomal protein L37AE/L43A
MNVVAQLDLHDSLQRAGARLASRGRADCPRCGKKRTVSYTGEVFFCHHADCKFKGNTFTLAKELGLAPTYSPQDLRRLALQRKRA